MELNQSDDSALSALMLSVDQRSAVPLYEQICQQIRKKIESHELEPGSQLPTNHQLRERLRVNYKTAQLAMATLAREGYVTRQARRGTIVKGIPRRGVVAIYCWLELLGHHTKYEYYRLIVGHLSQQLEGHGRVYRMYLGTGSPQTPNTASEDLLRHLEGGSLCGAVLVNPPPNVQELVHHAKKSRIPLVSFYNDGSEYSVRMDYPGFLRAAVAAVHMQGCRKVGVILNKDSIGLNAQPGIVPRILEEAGCPVNPSWILGGTDNEEGGYEAARWMRISEIDALIVTDDVMALGVDRRLAEIKSTLPQNLKLVTLWNRGTHHKLTLPFLRFELDVEEQARRVLQLIQDATGGQRITQPHVILMPHAPYSAAKHASALTV